MHKRCSLRQINPLEYHLDWLHPNHLERQLKLDVFVAFLLRDSQHQNQQSPRRLPIDLQNGFDQLWFFDLTCLFARPESQYQLYQKFRYRYHPLYYLQQGRLLQEWVE